MGYIKDRQHDVSHRHEIEICGNGIESDNKISKLSDYQEFTDWLNDFWHNHEPSIETRYLIDKMNGKR